ncbi:hypothetical protein ACKVV7_000831 [Pyricularia oryzae]
MSAAITLTLPGDYGYVLLAAASSFFLQTYHMVLSAKARKESGLMYPIAYAESQVAAKDPKAGFIGSALADLSLKFMALYAAYSVSFGQ